MEQYGVDLSESNIQGPLISLNILYDEMPETTGCEKCHEVNGDDAVWCCRTQSPSMYYIEFLNVWKQVQENWSKEDKLNLVLRAIRNHLSSHVNKGCIFFTDQCTVYEKRPFVCRMYGVISKENWDKRWDQLKEAMGDDFDSRPQCDLVSLKTGEIEVSTEDEYKWFRHISKCENRIGVPPHIINAHDAPLGSYRTFHDHLLMELFEEVFLSGLSQLRLSQPSQEEIEAFVKELRNVLDT